MYTDGDRQNGVCPSLSASDRLDDWFYTCQQNSYDVGQQSHLISSRRMTTHRVARKTSCCILACNLTERGPCNFQDYFTFRLSSNFAIELLLNTTRPYMFESVAALSYNTIQYNKSSNAQSYIKTDRLWIITKSNTKYIILSARRNAASCDKTIL